MRSNRGLGLLEVVISSGILCTVMILLLNLGTTSLFGTKEGGERLAAEGYALSVLEDYRCRPFSSYPLNQDIALPGYLEDGTTFDAVLRASIVADMAPESLRALTVTVRWSSSRGPRETTLASYASPLLR